MDTPVGESSYAVSAFFRQQQDEEEHTDESLGSLGIPYNLEISIATPTATDEDNSSSYDMHQQQCLDQTMSSKKSSEPKLYDRQGQRQLLLDAYRACKPKRKCRFNMRKADGDSAASVSNRELILITGNSGTGKSCLATSIRDEVLADRGFFVSGKFAQSLSTCSSSQQQQEVLGPQHQPDQQSLHSQRKPFAPFVSALTEWVEQVNQPSFESLQQKIKDVILKDKDLKAAIRVLVEEVPSLGSVLGVLPLPLSPTATLTPMSSIMSSAASDSSSSSDDGSSQLLGVTVDAASATNMGNSTASAKKYGKVQAQFAVVFRQFLQILCRLGHPLVLLMDDLQRADPSSLELLESLLSNTDDSMFAGLMIIGTCRPNEVAMQDPLSETLRRVEERNGRIVVIQIQNLGVQALCNMISDISGMSVDECQTLAETAFHETKGNALFARQYAEALCRDLNDENDGHDGNDNDHDSLPSMSERAMEATDERIVKWLVRQMRSLPDDTQYLLRVLSCLGGTFDRKTLQLTSLLSFTAVHEFIDICCARNLIVYDHEARVGRFAHDKYQEAAYWLLLPSDRPEFHLLLGRNLLEQCQTGDALEKYLSQIVDLLLIGREHLTDASERENLALWCLHVGRKVASSSSFAGPWAIGYMEQGMQLLGDRHWRDQYDLSLALHNEAARLAYCQDNHGRVGDLVDEVRRNARSFMDQVESYVTAIYSLGASEDPKAAIDVGFYVLEELGFPYPRNLSNCGMMRELYKTKCMLKKFSENNILNLPVNDNRRALLAMTVIKMLHPIFAVHSPEYTLLTGTRMVRLTLEYGSSPSSAAAFSMYSLTLMRLWKLDESKVYSQLAARLEEKQSYPESKGMHCLAQGLGPAFIGMQIGQAFGLIEKGQLACLENGDVETGVRAHMCLTGARFLFGCKLDTVAKEIVKSVNYCDAYSSIVTHHIVLQWQANCNVLMGVETEERFVELGNRLCVDIKIEACLLYALYVYTFGAMYMDQLDLGRLMMAEIRKRKATTKTLSPFIKIYHVFSEGILLAALGRTDKTMLRIAQRRLKRLQKLASHAPDNYSNKVCLLQAELMTCAGKWDQALKLYDGAILLSAKHGLVHELALACEKAGMMLLGCQRLKQGEKYLSKARTVYCQWGAHAKVAQLETILGSPQMSSSCTATTRTMCSSRQEGSHL